jgi:GT2 family glycosyltransferase
MLKSNVDNIMDMLSKVSVIICTKDRHEHLKTCLRSIISTDWPCNELIVVDSSINALTRDKNERLVRSVGGKYYYEDKRGLSAARNRGLKEAKGEIVIFADDDFIVNKGWIKNLIKNYDDYEVACCTGRMLSYRDDYASKLFEKSLSFDKGNKKRVFTRKDISLIKLLRVIPFIGRKKLFDRTPIPWAIGHGFCSFRRCIFNKVGYFDEKLGAGTPSLGGEELDMFYRILKRGYKIAYEPTAVVFHNHRQTLYEVIKAAYCAGASNKAFLSKYYTHDIYALTCYLGAFFLLTFVLSKASLHSDPYYKRMIIMELKGVLHRSKDFV